MNPAIPKIIVRTWPQSIDLKIVFTAFKTKDWVSPTGFRTLVAEVPETSAR